MPPATNVPRTHRSCNNVFVIRIFATLFHETPDSMDRYGPT